MFRLLPLWRPGGGHPSISSQGFSHSARHKLVECERYPPAAIWRKGKREPVWVAGNLADFVAVGFYYELASRARPLHRAESGD